MIIFLVPHPPHTAGVGWASVVAASRTRSRTRSREEAKRRVIGGGGARVETRRSGLRRFGLRRFGLREI